MTPTPKWSDVHASNVAFARHQLIEHGVIAPMFVLQCDDEIRLVQPRWDDDNASKANAYRLVGLLAAKHNARAIGFISEAWVRTVSPRHRETDAEYEARIAAIQPRDAEDREEVVICSLVYRDHFAGKQSLLTMLDIVRDATGKAVEAPERPGAAPDSQFVGPVLSLLSPVELTAAQRALAGQIYDLLLHKLGAQAVEVDAARGSA